MPIIYRKAIPKGMAFLFFNKKSELKRYCIKSVGEIIYINMEKRLQVNSDCVSLAEDSEVVVFI